MLRTFTGGCVAEKIRFKCPNCSKSVACDTAHAGKRSKCPGCGQTIEVPAALHVSATIQSIGPAKIAAQATPAHVTAQQHSASTQASSIAQRTANSIDVNVAPHLYVPRRQRSFRIVAEDIGLVVVMMVMFIFAILQFVDGMRTGSIFSRQSIVAMLLCTVLRGITATPGDEHKLAANPIIRFFDISGAVAIMFCVVVAVCGAGGWTMSEYQEFVPFADHMAEYLEANTDIVGLDEARGNADHIENKCLLIDKRAREIHPLQRKLPDYMRADNPQQVRTLVFIDWSSDVLEQRGRTWLKKRRMVLVSHYYLVSVIDLLSKKRWHARLDGDNAVTTMVFESATDHHTDWTAWPSKAALLDFIVSLDDK